MRYFYLVTFLFVLIALGFFFGQWRAYQEEQDVVKRIHRLIEEFNTIDLKERERTLKQLAQMGKPAVAPLVEMLEQKNRLVWLGAAETLSEIGKPAIEPLIIALKDKDYKGRGKAAYVLGLIGRSTGDSQAIRALMNALDDGAMVEAMIERLDDDTVPEGINNNLSETPRRDQPLDAVVAAILTQVGKPALDPLMTALDARMLNDSRNFQVRHWAATILGSIGDARLANSSGKSPNGVDANDRQLIIESLRRTLTYKFEVTLEDRGIEGKKVDKEAPMRANAARSLGMLHDARCIPPLTEALNDSDPSVRKSAAEAFGELGDPSVIPTLQARFNHPKEDQDVKAALYLAIQTLRNKPSRLR
jgi:HEAT repeat protein